MRFLLTIDEKENVGFTPFFEGDKLSVGIISYLSEPLPLMNIQQILDKIKPSIKYTKAEILKIIRTFIWGDLDFNWKECNSTPFNTVEEKAAVVDREDVSQRYFIKLVSGRQLSIGDLKALSRQLRRKDEEILRYAQTNVLEGRAEWVPAIKRHAKGWQCQRCGEQDVEEWPSHYGVAATCRSCESLGSSTSLEALYRDKGVLADGPAEVTLMPRWILTEAQRIASEAVLEFVKNETEEKALLWAACGAGKTEVCFPAAAWALNQGKSVLFAAPRQDVIQDVVPRLEQDFQNHHFQVLTGTTSVKFQTGAMVLATTHQVLRFWRAFDVIFLDEMDAFPYYGSHALEWGLHQALREGGKLLYLTATPSAKARKEALKGKVRFIRLPARHHRAPLPVPIWKKTRHLIIGDDGIGEWMQQLKQIRQDGSILVFVPKISWVDPWSNVFQQYFPEWRIGGSYSADPERTQKIIQLRQGVFDLFVSTTILERGITLPGIQVVVLGADHAIFDERALVQMAGRVGRTKEQSAGWVVFLSERRTPAMKKAIQWIEEQNRLALELGLIEISRE